MVLTIEAPVVWKALRGIICVYKPSGISVYGVRKRIIGNLANDLNTLKCRPPVNHVFIEDGTGGKVNVRVGPSYADNILTVGPRYLPQDIRCKWGTYMGRETSGVLVLGINEGTRIVQNIHETRPLRVYHVDGKLGSATDTYDIHGKVVERATYHHVKGNILNRVLSAAQAAYQKHTFSQSGVDIQSQAAYELAAQGTIRPSDGNMPAIYSLKCVHFKPPDFTIEIKCINEYESYLKTFIHDVGLQLHSAAVCTRIQCIRYGHFSLQHAILRRHWHLQYVLDNLQICNNLLKERKNLTEQLSPSLVPLEDNKLLEQETASSR